MSAADEAYKAAVAEIERVRREGGTSLDLRGEQFRALTRVPSEIEGWRELQSLDLRGTKVTDITVLPGLTELQSLGMWNTKITDIEALAGLTGLQSLGLWSTKITDIKALAGLTGLQSLDLRDTKITDITALAGLTALQSLDLTDTKITDITALAGLMGLQSLNLTGTKITDIEALAGLTGLQSLDLWGTQITNIIALAGLTGLQSLNLTGTQITDITALVGLTRLQSLNLSGTQISDITALVGLKGLQSLNLWRTQITDIAALAELVGLQSLDLWNTQITDITALAGLTGLQSLNLWGTQVRDLRPICDLPFDSIGNALSDNYGLRFADTPAAKLDETLGALAKIEDDKERTEKALAYLRGLPKYPAPLEWLKEVEPSKPNVPQGLPAPLQVIEVDGVLRPWMPGDGLDDEGRHLARQGWAILRDYLADLATIRPRIDNHIPNLGRALARLEAALGDRFEDNNAVAIGAWGQRVIRLAGATSDKALPQDDVAELQEFAAALALYLERFPQWREYRAKALSLPLDSTKLVKTLPAIAEIERELMDQVGVDPLIPNKLRDLRLAANEEPTDLVAAHGVLDSFGNVVSALMAGLWTAVRTAGRGVGWFLKTIAAKSAETIGGGVVLAAMDILMTKGAFLKTVASNFPVQFGWLLDFLKFFGV